VRTRNHVLNKWLVVFLLLTTMGCDQVTKQVARSIFPNRERRVTSIGVVHFRYAENPGGLMGIGEDLPESVRFWVLTVATGVGLGVLISFLLHQRGIPLLQGSGLVLLAGGGASNLLDRMLNEGRVVDFMVVRVGELQTGVFNVADVVIIFGFGLILTSLLLPPRVSSPPPPAP
jgi:signal peptidase II